MRLITCNNADQGASFGHPCAKAMKALDEAGHRYDHDTVGGAKLLPWTRRGDVRDEVERLSGQKDVPILVLDDGTVVTGHKNVVEWARTHSPA
jgi:glutathione S-transferase